MNFSALLAATDAATIIGKIKTNILNPIIMLGFGAALIFFLYGVMEAIRGAASEEGRKAGQQHMLWGLFGMFIMMSAFGIMQLICGTIDCVNPN